MPPRHGKSEITTKRLPAYFLGRHPEMSIISASYSASLATRFGRAVQQIMLDDVYDLLFPDVILPGTTKAVARGFGRDSVYTRTADLFETCGYGGSYRCTGVGGGVTGMGADIFLIDDPVKDRAEADSFTIRENVWDWFTSTAYTRLAPGCGIIVVMTPWHMNDLAGRLLEEEQNGGDRYEVLRFPAIAEVDEELRRAGEALHPARYSREALQKIQSAKPKIFISGHSHILKVIYDNVYDLLHINPGAAGCYGFHNVSTAIRFTIDGSNIRDMEIGHWDRDKKSAW
jgi:hypothetical protein